MSKALSIRLLLICSFLLSCISKTICLEKIESVTQEITSLFIYLDQLNASICHDTFQDPNTGQFCKSFTHASMSINTVFMDKRVLLSLQLSKLELPVKIYKNQIRNSSLVTIDLSEKVNEFKSLLDATQKLKEEMQLQLVQQNKEKQMLKVKLCRSVSAESEESV